MKKILICIFGMSLLSACSDGLISPMDSGDRMPRDEAVLIGKIELSPALDEDGDLTKKTKDDFQTVFLTFTSSKTVKDKQDTYQEFDEVETNKYFALPIATEDSLNLQELQFVISRKSWFSNTEYIYRSTLKKIQFPVGQKLTAGEVYNLGTIKIKLHQKSFKETGDEEYDDEEAHYIVPEHITLEPETESAKTWFIREFPKTDKKVNSAKAAMRATDEQNTFNETQITTTYR